MGKKMINNENFNQFIDSRNQLIEKLEKKEITKTEFIEENYGYFLNCDIEPVDEPQSIEQGIFNYQYYNIMAKYSFLMKNELEFRNPHEAANYNEQAFNFYKMKDKATLAMIELVNYENVEAYYVDLLSSELEGKLFEVIIKGVEKAVFHSKDKRILNRLEKNGVFNPDKKKSVIHDYVNTKY